MTNYMGTSLWRDTECGCHNTKNQSIPFDIAAKCFEATEWFEVYSKYDLLQYDNIFTSLSRRNNNKRI